MALAPPQQAQFDALVAGDENGAILTALIAAMEADIDDIAAWCASCSTLAKRGCSAEAIEILFALKEAHPNDISIRIMLADIFKDHDQIVNAKLEADGLYQLVADDHSKMRLAFDLYKRLGSWYFAKRVIDKMILLKPDQLSLRKDRINLLIDSLGSSSKTDDLRGVIRLDLEVLVRTGGEHYFASQNYRKLGDLRAALEAMLQVINVGLARNEDYIELAQVRSAMNDHLGVQDALDRVIVFNSDLETASVALLYARHNFKKKSLAIVVPLASKFSLQKSGLLSVVRAARALTLCDRKAEGAALLRTLDLANLSNLIELRLFHDTSFEAGALDLAYATATEGARRDAHDAHYQKRLALLRIIYKPDQTPPAPTLIPDKKPKGPFRSLFRKPAR